MNEKCQCPLCGSDAKFQSSLECTIYFCAKCGEFQIKTFTGKPVEFTTTEKEILSHYFANVKNSDPYRKKIITNDNYVEILEHCKKVFRRDFIMTLFAEFNNNLSKLRDKYNTFSNKLHQEDKNKYLTICSHLDLLEDATEAIRFFQDLEDKFSTHECGEEYLKLYGLFDCIKRQWISIIELYEIFNLDKDKLELEFAHNEFNYFYNTQSYCVFVMRNLTTNEECKLSIWDKNSQADSQIIEINFDDLIQKHVNSLNYYVIELTQNIRLK